MWTSEEIQNLGVSINDAGFKKNLTTRDKEVCARMNVQETITMALAARRPGALFLDWR